MKGVSALGFILILAGIGLVFFQPFAVAPCGYGTNPSSCSQVVSYSNPVDSSPLSPSIGCSDDTTVAERLLIINNVPEGYSVSLNSSYANLGSRNVNIVSYPAGEGYPALKNATVVGIEGRQVGGDCGTRNYIRYHVEFLPPFAGIPVPSLPPPPVPVPISPPIPSQPIPVPQPPSQQFKFSPIIGYLFILAGALIIGSKR